MRVGSSANYPKFYKENKKIKEYMQRLMVNDVGSLALVLTWQAFPSISNPSRGSGKENKYNNSSSYYLCVSCIIDTLYLI